MNEHADTVSQRTGHVDLVGAQQGDVEPAQLSGCQGRKFGVQVDRRRENGAGDVAGLDAILPNDQRQQLTSGLQVSLPVSFRPRSSLRERPESSSWISLDF